MIFEGLLTASEERIASLISRGEGTTTIARKLEMSTVQLEHELARILEKLRITNRLELILYSHSRLQELEREGNAA